MTDFAACLALRRGVTAIIGGGGKTTLLYRLAEELSRRGTVLVTTTTHIFRPAHLPCAERAEGGMPLLCVGTPCAGGKLTAPRQSFAALAALADYVLVEADGSRRLPIKAHAPHEPVIPENAEQVICVVGASGLYGRVDEVVHRPEVFARRTGERETATPQAVAQLLAAEQLHTRVLVNQADAPARAEAALELLDALPGPRLAASLQKGEILCSF